ncbi:NUDIX domain-containing protein [Helcobacillus massiliensis]|uniref:NUDIX domain-containing protein n=1 Tax=Helcobacillus massiliensis TaxID=521392 RepID=UPI002552C769|nr:NUDIX domain-containing protein [Helcobacillus massiliensis]MDK7742806.1 NUDIX domain-containing protein [Helcobacillus massiliensis]WOO93457.1 NUDIX domain-containing protein [Helcobacillus massiliensis]
MNTEPPAAAVRRIVLLAGPSGSGKGRLGALAGIPLVQLDDFYCDGDEPGLPQRFGIVDWDHPASWKGDDALQALIALCHEDSVRIPTYSIPRSARTGTQTIRAAGFPIVLAEGVFAAELVEPLQRLGLLADGIVLDRPTALVTGLRVARDVRERRKPLPTIMRRAVGLARSQKTDVATWASKGLRPLGFRDALARVRALLTAADAQTERAGRTEQVAEPPVITVSAVCFTHFTPPGPGVPNGQWRLFSVRKKGTDRFMQPGGKPEPGETAVQAAVREVKEELNISLAPHQLVELGSHRTMAANEAGHALEGTVFLAPQVHNPTDMAIRAELEEARWIDIENPSDDVPIAPLMREFILPALRERLR